MVEKPSPSSYGILNGNHFPAEPLLAQIHDHLEVGIGMIDLVDDEEGRFVHFG
jgi:hypothetical protein